MFFEDDDGYRYPISRIARIGAPQTDSRSKGAWTHAVGLSDGDVVKVRGYEVQRIASLGTAVPALPGYYVLHADGPKVEDSYKAPIIAWVVGSDGSATPVTPDGANDGVDSIIHILTPDNKVIHQGDRSWDSVEDFLLSQSEKS